MTRKRKVTLAVVALAAAVLLSLWLTHNVYAAGGIGAVIAGLLGWKAKNKPMPASTRDGIADLVDDGLKATEDKIEFERDRANDEAVDAVRNDHSKLEEMANASGDDPTAWTRDS